MAIADDISVSVAGDIRYTGSTANYTVLELHRFLQDLADDAQAVVASSDYMDISFPTPSERIYDTIIVLNAPYNIDDTLAEHLYGGSIAQYDTDDLLTLYSGLRVLGKVNDSDTQIQVIQDNALYDGDAPFWGDQVSPYNGGGNVLFRILVKSVDHGFKIDGGRIRIRAGNWGDTFASFDVTLGVGESVGAITTTPDPQNDTAHATVAGWTGGDIPTNTEGYQQIDIQDGNGNQPYYSKWTYNTNAAEMKALWEWSKYITEVGTSQTLYGIDGDLFVGITDDMPYDGQSTNFQEDEYVVWGTHIWYDNESGGTLARGNYVVFSGGNAGKILWANGTDEIVVAVDDTSITIADNETITEYNGSTHAKTGVTAAVDTGAGGGSPIEDNDQEGGEMWVLAMSDAGATGELWGQRTYGLSAVDDMPLFGVTSGGDGDALLDATNPTIPSVFLGSYSGSLIGAFGVGVDPDDLGYPDTITDLDGDVNTAPNNVTYTLSGLVSGEDYVLIMNKDAVDDDFEFAEMTLATTLNGATETQIDVGLGNVPADAPASGVLRVTLDDGRHRRIAYNSHDTQYFYVTSSNWTDPNDATAGKGVSLAFIDKLATSSSEQFTLQYNAPRTLWQRRRDGGTAGDGIPTKTWEQQGNLTDTGGSAIAARLSDA